jgi:hypothetical protein
MAQMGHASPTLALAIYARCMNRRDGEGERLRALVEGRDWARAGTSAAEGLSESPAASPVERPKTAL